MELKLKKQYSDTTISCPFTGHLINLNELDKAFYQLWYNKGLTYLFEIVEPEKKDKTK